MKDQLISSETAKLAKERGFNIPVLNCYNENQEINDVEFVILHNFNQYPNVKGSNTNLYSVPTQSLLQKWLREVHNMDIIITPDSCSGHRLPTRKYFVTIWTFRNGLNVQPLTLRNDKKSILYFHEKENGIEYGLQEALKLIKSD